MELLIKNCNPGDSYRYEVKVGGTSIGHVMNKQPKEFTNVKVFGADNWSNPAQGSIRNLVINPNTPTPQQGRIIYFLAFIIKNHHIPSFILKGRDK